VGKQALKHIIRRKSIIHNYARSEDQREDKLIFSSELPTIDLI